MFHLYLLSESKIIIENVKKRKERQLTDEEYEMFKYMTEEFKRTGVLPKNPIRYRDQANSYVKTTQDDI